MDKKVLFIRRLRRIVRECRMPLRGKELVESRLCWEDWLGLRQEAVIFAREEIGRRRWRGAQGGVLPGGGDAEDIANQTIVELLQGKCRLAFGWTRERILKELKRLVGQKVRVLRGLRETAVMRSEWDAEPVGEGEEATSVFNAIPDEKDEAQDEAKERLREIEDFLADEPKLKAVFGCLSSGIRNPAEIGRQLGMDEREVVRTRKKLDRRLAVFRGRLACEVSKRCEAGTGSPAAGKEV